MAIKLTARALKNQQHEQNIQQAASALFAEYGYDPVTVDDICEKACISKSTFYNLYKSKEDLFMIEVDKRRGEYQLRHYTYDENASLRQNLHSFFRVQFEFIQSDGPEKTRKVYRSYMSVGDIRSAFAQNKNHPYLKELDILVTRGISEGSFTCEAEHDELMWMISDALIGLFVGWASHMYPSDSTDARYARMIEAFADALTKAI